MDLFKNEEWRFEGICSDMELFRIKVEYKFDGRRFVFLNISNNQIGTD